MTPRSESPQLIIMIVIALMAVFIVVAMAVGVLWYFQNYIEPDLTGPSSNIYTKCAKHCQDTKVCESKKIVGQKIVNGECKCDCLEPSSNVNINSAASPITYSSEELGFSFKYPSILGTANYNSDLPAETGKAFQITFSDNENFIMGGISNDFSAGREGSFIDSRGYYEKNGKYYFHFVSSKEDTTYPLEPLKVLTVDEQKILIVNRFSFIGHDYLDGPYLHPGEIT